jgi:hypothetical protein
MAADWMASGFAFTPGELEALASDVLTRTVWSGWHSGASPKDLLEGRNPRPAKVTESKITFPETGATITALASDYAGAAGSNANCVCFDELWAYTSERSRRLWDEMIPPPTRKIACRLTTTYAGFDGESTLLWDLHKRTGVGFSRFDHPGWS